MKWISKLLPLWLVGRSCFICRAHFLSRLILLSFSSSRHSFWREHEPTTEPSRKGERSWTMDDHDELAQTLLDDDQPSWVTLTKEDHNDDNITNSHLNGGGDVRSSVWDRNNTVGKKNHQGTIHELPKFIPFLRIGNMGAAFLLIYGSVSVVCR